MKLPVIYVLTHDSIGVGEDGPTHEPIEHLAALRSIPNFITYRPADSREVAAAGVQPNFKRYHSIGFKPSRLTSIRRKFCRSLKGAYILQDYSNGTPDMILMATGSEVQLIVEAKNN